MASVGLWTVGAFLTAIRKRKLVDVEVAVFTARANPRSVRCNWLPAMWTSYPDRAVT